jgi:hypothetical protein
MNSYTFQEMISDLRIGREIEFQFDNNTYGIVNAEGYWYFCCTEKKSRIQLCEFNNKDELISKVLNLKISGIDLKDIIDSSKYKEGSLYIL